MGEVSIGGVYIPGLLLLGLAALVIVGVLTQLFQIIGLYRFVAYRPLIDLCLFIFVLGGLVILSAPYGSHP
jgi:hypothetical protein